MRQVQLLEEQEFSAYNFEYADPVITRKLFELHEKEAGQLLDALREAGPPNTRSAFRSLPPTTIA